MSNDNPLKLIDTNLYDVVLLEARPTDILDQHQYRILLTKSKDGNEHERAGEWVLKVYVKVAEKWRPTPGQWYFEQLIGQDDTISVDGGSKWKILGMIEIMEEAMMRINDFESNEMLGVNSEKKKEYKDMSKHELNALVNQAIDDKNYELLNKLSKHVKENWNIPYLENHILNEKMVQGGGSDERIIDLRGPTGNAYNILGMAKRFCNQLKEYNEKYDWEKVEAEMTSKNYKHLVETFEKYFGDYVTIINSEVLDGEEYKIDEAIKHLKPRSKSEIIRNMKKFKKKKKRKLSENLNEKDSSKFLMGHNSPNPDDPEVNGTTNRITDEDIEELEESVNEEFHSETDSTDDLKANFRSWEMDHDNEEDAISLYHLLVSRHPNEDESELKSLAFAWVGYESEFVENEDEFVDMYENNIIMKSLFIDSLNEDNLAHSSLKKQGFNKFVKVNGDIMRKADDAIHKKIRNLHKTKRLNVRIIDAGDYEIWFKEADKELIAFLKKYFGTNESFECNEGCGCRGRKKTKGTPLPKKSVKK